MPRCYQSKGVGGGEDAGAEPRWWRGHVDEIALVITSSLLVGAFAVWVDLFERLDAWLLATLPFRTSELDELLFVFAVASLGGGVFAYRRWCELRTALLARERAEAERADVERQLQQARRLEALGRVAGGVAHDFNNLLTVILGFSDVIVRGLDRRSPLLEPASEVKRAGEAAARLTRQLLEFSRKNRDAATPLWIDDVLGETRGMLERVLGADVALELRAGAPETLVEIDRGQLEQVILNLVMNARDAMPAGGRLVVRTALAGGPDDPGRARLAPARGPCVALAVADSGTGMSADTIEHAFEPFFTTKANPNGTGLGLATVYGIVRQCGGGIGIESRPGGGTTMTVYLPIAGRPAERAAAPAPPLRPVVRLAQRDAGTILLVEDNEAVRTLLAGALEQAGHRVLVAVDGIDGLDVAARFASTIDVVVTDLVMPRMNGAELAALLRRRRPEIRVVFMSGFTSTVLDEAPEHDDVPLLAKPFPPRALVRAVRAELDARATLRASETRLRVARASRG